MVLINLTCILVVDDEFDIVNTIRLWLYRHGFDVCGFTDPLLALEHFKDNYNKIDLVLSDIRMPQMNGYELANSLKALKPKVKIILMSAFEIREVEFSKMFHSFKIDSLISKPISMKNLREDSKCILTLVISQDTLIPSIKYTRYTYTHNIPLL